MTSRLKHKLQDVEVSSNYNESFCQIGTPLPALADTKKKDAGEYVPVWKQEVTDEQGRRRLHGAFTGGFSAGYFNTVGSKEGWAPSAFVSSRTNRASATQKAEDFMDDEDKAEMRADQKLETRQGFGLEDKKPHDGAEGVPDYLSSLVQPSSSAIGVKLLTKLGWRPGQGVGPRVTARALERQDAKTSLYDRSLGHGGKGAGNAENDDGLDEEAKKHLFAPRDTPLRVYPPKDGTEGLGWAKGAGLSQPSTRDNVDINESGEGPKRTGGFGYGLEDADEDDADVYATGPSSDITSGRGRFAFHQDDGDDEILQMGSRESKKAKKPLQPSNANASTSTWHDGRPVVRGFTVAAAPVKEDRWFSPLEVPKGWTPKPSRVWDRGKKWDLTPSQAAEKVENAGKEREVLTGDEAWRRRQAMTSDTRGALLGEQQISLPPPPPKTTSEPPLKASAKSVFEFMSAKDRERIASFAAAQAAGPSVSSDSPAASEPRPPSPAAFTVPTVDPPTANSALHGFMPFGEDPAKQARYRSYLSSQATGTDPTGVLLTRSGQTQEQLFHELSSFQKAAQIFRPLSVSMSSRFTSSSSAAASVETQPIKAGLFVMDAETRAARLKEKEQQAEEDRQAKLKPIILENETAMQQAARMGMYGTMTRETKDFFPVKLLCKRFGVKDPHPEGPSSADDSGAYASAGSGLKPIVDPNAWQSKFIHVTPLSQVDSSAPAESSAAQAAAVALQSVTADPKAKGGVSLGEEGELEKEAAKLERPPMDIFKAIFASDDEDSSDEEEEQHLAPSLSAKLAAPAHSTASLPPPASSTIVESEDEDVVGPLKPPPPSSLSASLDPTGMAFRPTFNVAPKASLSSSASKDKKKKKKKEKKAIVSFGGEDEDEDEASAGATVERERTQRERRGMKRTRESEAATASTEEEIWVEKPAALTVEGAAEEQDRQILDGGAGLKRARRTAADFL